MLFDNEQVRISAITKGTIPAKVSADEAKRLGELGMAFRSASINGVGYCAFVEREGILTWLGIRLVNPLAVMPFYIPRKLTIKKLDKFFVLTTQRDGSLGFDSKILNPRCVGDLCRDGNDRVILTDNGCLYTIEQVLLRNLDECKNLSMDKGFSAVIDDEGQLLHLFHYGDVVDDLNRLKSLTATSLWNFV